MVIHSDALPSKLDTGYKPIFFKKYKIQPNDLLKCVKCPRCKILPMAKTKGSWLCGNCQYTSKNAFFQPSSISLLFGSTITNKQCRNFLQLHSRSISTNLLRSLNIKKNGNNRYASYVYRILLNL